MKPEVFEDFGVHHGMLRQLQSLGFAILLIVVLLAPLPLGSNRPWPLALIAILVWTGVALAAPFVLTDGSSGTRLARLRWPMYILAALCAIPAMQLAGANVGLSVLGTQSSWDTRHYLLRSLTYAGAVLLLFMVVNSRVRCMLLMGAMLVAGFVQAALGILLSRSGQTYELMFAVFEPGGRVSGTFANPNHFAGFLSLSLACGIGLLIAQYEGDLARRDGWQARLASMIHFCLSAKMLLRLSLVIMVIAMVLSHSRMGNLAFFVALIAAGSLLAARSKKLRRPAVTLVVTMIIIDLLVIGQWIGFDRIAERFQATNLQAEYGQASGAPRAGPEAATTGQGFAAAPPREESLEERLEVPRLAARLILNAPILGHGGGTFYLTFPPHKPEGAYPGFWKHAHNDFVEVAIDLGFVGVALWVGLGATAALTALRLLDDRQPRLNRGVGVATLLAIIASSLQSAVDFGLQIPANALNFSLTLGLAWAVQWLPLRQHRGPLYVAA